MAFDLYSQESEARIGGLRPVKTPEAGAFDNFFSGTGRVAMRGFAEAGRAASMALAAPLVAVDKMAEMSRFGGAANATLLQDKFFAAHDEIFGRAVDAWAPKPGEVGVAGEVAGQLLSTLPLVIASPAAAVAKTQLTTGEDLVRKGVDPLKAGAVGAVQGAGLGLGIWLPILGTNGWQRVVVGGAGANVAQGIGTRAASGAILDGTPAADEFKAFDPTALTLDTLLGIAFGGLAHLSPAQRAQGERAWQRIDSWLKNADQTQVDALATLRQAQHLNVDSAPGVLATPQDIDAHVQRIRTAIDDLANDRPVRIDDLPAAKFEADPARAAAQREAAATLTDEAARVQAETGMKLDPLPERAKSQGAESLLPEAAGVDPLHAEAARFVDANPDLEITVGRDADGAPVRRKLREYMDEQEATVARAQEDAKLFDVAAACLLGAA